MNKIRWQPIIVAGVAFLLVGLVPTTSIQGQVARYEVWTIDQADAARGGARLYIFDGQRLESGQPGSPEVINLDTAAAGVGDGPGVRPHMIAFTGDYRHAIISNVASGHVYVMRTTDRRIIASVDVGEQAHHAEPSADGQWILVANQNGKRFARIRADFSAGRFTYNRADDLNLAALENPGMPDNAPVCPLIVGGKAYVTVRGGGLYIVDYQSTPMRVLRSYTREQVGPAGCGGAMARDKVYINSGTAETANLYVFSAASDALMKSMPLTWAGADGHGLLVVGGGRYLWMGNRATSTIVVINTERDVLAGFITGFGTAPDIMALSPSGNHVFVALRGPNNLTGGPSAKGETPGIAVFQVLDGGRSGRRILFVPIGDQSPASSVDPHTIGVRVVR
jgi:DNA-binding beta-propeller fold protein YncE